MTGPWEKFQNTKNNVEESTRQPSQDGPWSRFANPKKTDAPLNKNEETPNRSFQAGLEGFGEGVSLGYLNNLQALTEPLTFKALNFITGKDVKADDYVEARDSYNKRQESLAKENPKSFMTGQVAGTIASAIPAAGAGAAAGTGRAAMAARGLQAAKAGTIYGATQNTQETEGQLGGLDIPQRIENAGTGMATGILASYGGEALGAGAKAAGKKFSQAKNAIGESLKDVAETQMFKSTGAMLKDFRNSFGKGEINEIGRWLLDKGEIGIGDSVDDIAAKTLKYKQQAGEALDQVYSNAEELLKNVMSQKGFDPLRDKQRILSAARKELGDTVGAENAIKKLSDHLDGVAAKHGDAPFEQAMSQFSKEKQQYIRDAQQFRKDLRSYRNQVGSAGDDIDQGLLPAFSDDMQRTGQRSQQVEVGGKNPSQMRSQPYEPEQQLDLLNMPTGNSEAERLFARAGEANFGNAGGETANRLGQNVVDSLEAQGQQDFLKRNFVNQVLNSADQGSIGGLTLTPRSYAQGKVPTVNQGSGQTQFAIAPNRPVRPNAPEQIRNGMNPRRANDIKGALDEQINYARNPLSKEPASEKAFLGARRELNKIIDESIDELGGKEASQALKTANKEYSLASKANRISQDKVNRESSNRVFGLTDTIAGGFGAGYGAITGDWETAITAMAAKKGFEKYGTIGIAKLADSASKRLLQNPKMAQLAQVNPQAFKATVFSILDKIPKPSEAAPAIMQKAASNEAPQKGPDKWASVGSSKLIDSGIDQQTIEKLKQSKKGRDLLFRASDLPSNSKAMQNLMGEIQREGEM